MNNKKQTAVEWLVENILTHVQDYKDWDIKPGQKPDIDEYINKYIGFVDLSEFVNKAKAMEKKQIIDFAEDYEINESEKYPQKTFEQYYNETFKTNQDESI